MTTVPVLLWEFATHCRWLSTGVYKLGCSRRHSSGAATRALYLQPPTLSSCILLSLLHALFLLKAVPLSGPWG